MWTKIGFHLLLWSHVFIVGNAALYSMPMITQPHEVCILSDTINTEVTAHNCGLLSKKMSEFGDYIENKQMTSNARIREFIKKLLQRGKVSATEFSILIPCLNRQYACDNGYSFIAANMPTLSIYQPEVVPDYRTREAFEDYVSSACSSYVISTGLEVGKIHPLFQPFFPLFFQLLQQL
jgi:hypothetical protein